MYAPQYFSVSRSQLKQYIFWPCLNFLGWLLCCSNVRDRFSAFFFLLFLL